MHIYELTPNFVPIWDVCTQVTTVIIYAKSCLGITPIECESDSQELVLNAAVHKILLTVFTINQLIPIIIWQLF